MTAGEEHPGANQETIACKRLSELASIIRSKNAGPYRLTFDILFDDAETFRQVCNSGAITRESVAQLYGVAVSQISSLFEFPMGNAIKVTMIRPIPHCAPGESDVYGCQQHAPLMDILVPVGGNF